MEYFDGIEIKIRENLRAPSAESYIYNSLFIDSNNVLLPNTLLARISVSYPNEKLFRRTLECFSPEIISYWRSIESKRRTLLLQLKTENYQEKTSIANQIVLSRSRYK